MTTHSDAAKAALQEIEAHGQSQEALALQTLLALGSREIEAGETKAASAVCANLIIE